MVKHVVAPVRVAGGKIGWPKIEVPESQPPERNRRSWGNMSYEERYRTQHETLLDAVRAIADEKGYSGTQITDIVSRAGVSRRTFYEHFGSKEACFGELLLRAAAVAIDAFCEAAERALPDGPRATFLAIIESWSKGMGGDFTISRRLAGSLWSESQAPGSPLIGAMNDARAAFAEVFVVAALRLGSTMPDDLLRLAARMQVGGLVSVIDTRNTFRSAAETDLLAQVVTVSLGLDPS